MNEPKKVEKIISGTASEKKGGGVGKVVSSIGSIFLEEVSDVVIPRIKDITSDIIIDIVKTLLYGTKHTATNKNKPFASYDYSSISRSTTAAQKQTITQTTSYSYNDIVLDSRGDAEMVLDQMRNLIENYKSVSVADMYDLAGIASKFTDNKYGWRDLSTASVANTREGYMIKLPKAIVLD